MMVEYLSALQRRARASMAVLAMAAALPAAAASTAADWPAGPVRLVVPYSAGALTDNLGRMLAEQLRPVVPEGVVVENKPGAGTQMGASQVARAAPDGQTLMMATSTTLGISQGLFAKPLVQVDELTGVAMLGRVSLFLVTRADFPASTVSELVALLQQNPGKYVFAHPGNGTPHHLLSELFKQSAGVEVLEVPFTSSPQALTELLAGRIDMVMLDASLVRPHVEAGTLKAVATTAPQPSPLFPAAEALPARYPGMELPVWQGVVAPNGLPPELLERLNAEINRIMADPATQARVRQVGLDPVTMGVADFNAMIQRDAPRWRELVKASGAKVD